MKKNGIFKFAVLFMSILAVPSVGYAAVINFTPTGGEMTSDAPFLLIYAAGVQNHTGTIDCSLVNNTSSSASLGMNLSTFYPPPIYYLDGTPIEAPYITLTDTAQHQLEIQNIAVLEPFLGLSFALVDGTDPDVFISNCTFTY